MSAPIELSALDLAALLCSRVCHDVINPVGAMENGFQLLEMDQNAQSREEALGMIRQSATQASIRLRYARIAYGAAGSAGAQIDLGDAQELAVMHYEPNLKVTWNLPRALLPKNRVKLLLNMMLIAAGIVPKGGTMVVDPAGEGERMGFKIRVEGPFVRVHAAVPALLEGTPPSVDAQVIQPFYTGVLARAEGLKIGVESDASGATLSAQ